MKKFIIAITGHHDYNGRLQDNEQNPERRYRQALRVAHSSVQRSLKEASGEYLRVQPLAELQAD